MNFRIAAGLSVVMASLELLAAQNTRVDRPLSALSDSIRALADRVSPAVVEIQVTGYATKEDERGLAANQVSRQSSSGSGVILDSSGYIVTNAHVVQGAVKIRVFMPKNSRPAAFNNSQTPHNRAMNARLIGIDRDSDVALIRIDEKDLPVLPIADSDKLQQGDLVFAVGSPMGLRNSVSMGVVSATRRAISDENPVLYIQTDASVNPGNSGGALVDSDGSLVGLNTFIVSRSGGNEGIGFAIPSNVVRSVYEQLKRKGRVSRGTIGLFVQNISPTMAAGLGLSLQEGAVIADVEPDSPADVADLKRRDIILSLNGHTIESARQFQDEIGRREGGEKIAMVVQRGTQRVTVSVEVKEQMAAFDPLATLVSPEKNLVHRLGILCIEIDREVARLIPQLRRSYGVIVAAKAPEGQAQFIDIQQGDVIHSVNNEPVALLSAFRTMIQEFKPGDAVVLQIERDGRFQYVAFEIE
jgi:serine protease Do